MARIYPFRALRYDTSRVKMEDVVTQPYDKITPEMQQRYYERSPYNLIRIILGKHEPDDTEAQEFLPQGEKAHNVYTRADQIPKYRLGVRGRSKCGNNFGPSLDGGFVQVRFNERHQ